jgi:hypothetical protein
VPYDPIKHHKLCPIKQHLLLFQGVLHGSRRIPLHFRPSINPELWNQKPINNLRH